LSCTYLAHHELESVLISIIIISTWYTIHICSLHRMHPCVERQPASDADVTEPFFFLLTQAVKTLCAADSVKQYPAACCMACDGTVPWRKKKEEEKKQEEKKQEEKKQEEKKTKKKIAGRLLTQAASNSLQSTCFLCAQK